MSTFRDLGRGGRFLLALAVGGALFGVSAAVQADIPDGTSIQGCYANRDGSLRVIDASAGQTCDTKKESPITWNQVGPAGPPGVSLFANVDSDGTLVSGTATGSTRIALGVYRVTFARDVSNCAAVANPGQFPGADFVSTADAFASTLTFLNLPDVVQVVLEPLSRPPYQVDSDFRVIVAC
jgi:hypothetical protein